MIEGIEEYQTNPDILLDLEATSQMRINLDSLAYLTYARNKRTQN